MSLGPHAAGITGRIGDDQHRLYAAAPTGRSDATPNRSRSLEHAAECRDCIPVGADHQTVGGGDRRAEGVHGLKGLDPLLVIVIERQTGEHDIGCALAIQFGCSSRRMVVE